MFDLFHILLNGFWRILKRKRKENHFSFIEKNNSTERSVDHKKRKQQNKETIDRYITEDKYAKEL